MACATPPRHGCIVIAWTTAETRFVGAYGGRISARGYGAHHPDDWEDYIKGHAVVWANNGTEEDLLKAQAWAVQKQEDGCCVYTFDSCERDPLGKAKSLAVRQAQARKSTTQAP